MPAENEEDLALSRRAAGGDHLAFALLVEKHERALRSFLMRMGAGDLADDIAQEAFLKAWKAAGQYDGRAGYTSRLTRNAWRCRLDQLRRHRLVEPDSWANGPDPADEVQDLLARLTDNERVALVLCDGHGWTHSEAAELLSMPLGTLKSTVARAMARCREMWRRADG